MSDVYFDASGIEAAPTRDILDEGIYHVQIKSATSGRSKNKGTPQIDIVGKVVDDVPMQINDSTPRGREIYYTLYFAEGENAKISKRSLMDLYKAVNLEPPEDGRFNLADLVGREVFFVVKHEEYQGTPRMRVNSIKAIQA
jgi:hypothetical protein